MEMRDITMTCMKKVTALLMNKKMNEQILAENNGQDGKPVFVVMGGAIFDVSQSKLWKGGRHMNRHDAGHDLTADFADAPHGPEVFERFTRVGTLQGGSSDSTGDLPKRLPSWLDGLLLRYPLLARHPHPAMVHFPIAFFMIAPVFSLPAILFGNGDFETTAFHCLVVGTVTAPVTIGSGFFTWWLNYDAHLLKQIKIKIVGSVLLMLLAIVLVIWRYKVPELIFTDNSLRIFYLFLFLTLIPLVSLIGWNGAILTFPHGKN